jgi:hypothetical protein
MTCEIIQFSASTRPARTVSEKPSAAEVTAFVNRGLTPREERRREKPELPPPATETAKNCRIRSARRDAWWRAERLEDYWRARLDWQHTLSTAPRYGIGDSASFPSAGTETRFELLDIWREAVAKKLLTPAPDHLEAGATQEQGFFLRARQKRVGRTRDRRRHSIPRYTPDARS